MNLDEVYLAELELAATRRADAVVPKPRLEWRRVLDVGCGAGQALVALEVGPEVELYGTDVKRHALKLGQEFDDRIQFLLAPGEQLPFASNRFDLVCSQTALPYMHIPTALAEMCRVLRPGGQIWFTVFPAREVFNDLRLAVLGGKVRSALHHAYRMVNGSLFQGTGKLVRLPFGKRRCESYQTVGSIRRALGNAGFAEIEVEEHKTFIVFTASEAQATAGR